MRLIDADELIRWIHRNGSKHGVTGLVRCNFESFVNRAPTVDAEPVRRGQWIIIDGFTECSECGAIPAYWEATPGNPYGYAPYCHSCGAKMERGDKGEKHDPTKCRYYKKIDSCAVKGRCIATFEIDPCEGCMCDRWRPKGEENLKGKE